MTDPDPLFGVGGGGGVLTLSLYIENVIFARISILRWQTSPLPLDSIGEVPLLTPTIGSATKNKVTLRKQILLYSSFIQLTTNSSLESNSLKTALPNMELQ